MNDELRVPDYLGHFRDAIEKIFRYVEDLDETAFARDEFVQDAVIRNLEHIGEASRNIERADPTFASRHPDMELASARAMRNALSHGYHKVDIESVWTTVAEDLSILQRQVVDLLRGLEPPG